MRVRKPATAYRPPVRLVFALMAVLAIAPAGSRAQSTNPDNLPLTFGMSADAAAHALGVPLNYVRGRPGNELYLALSNVRESVLSSRRDGLYLQFHRGRLEGWKGDWGASSRGLRAGYPAATLYDGRGDDCDLATNGYFPGNFATSGTSAQIGAARLLSPAPPCRFGRRR
ncbi:hypothetical protein [Bradyrhizobium sp.]|uniref:hypothetical protein n=1 Tax=Bradyrhizobium sp. TaxID=376 RepID=UPI0039E3E4FD